MFRLDGKTALVTGASGGIGAAIARALHAQGAVVALSGTRRDALEALAAELGERTHVCPADLRDAAEPDSLIEAAETAAGPLTILVNNAGMTRDMLALRMRDADWQSVLDVDLSAPFRLTRAALRGMVRRRAGRIINISSIVGITGSFTHGSIGALMPDWSPVCGLTSGSASSWRSGISKSGHGSTTPGASAPAQA